MSVPLRYLLREARLGNTIFRILINWVLYQWRDILRGLVIDFGCGDNPSYWRLMGIQGNPQVRYLVGVDHSISCQPTIVADLNDALPIKDQTADVVIIGGVLMLLADPQALLSESRRVLIQRGVLLVYTALIWHHNPAPHDYWRFTEEALRLTLERAGFVDITIVPIGGRWTAVIYLLSPFLRPRWLVAPMVYWLCLKLDAWTAAWWKRLPSCPIGYVAKAMAAS